MGRFAELSTATHTVAASTARPLFLSLLEHSTPAGADQRQRFRVPTDRTPHILMDMRGASLQLWSSLVDVYCGGLLWERVERLIERKASGGEPTQRPPCHGLPRHACR